MEVMIECDSYLNKANYYERKGQVSLNNISNYVHLVEKSCISAVNYIQKAMQFLEAAKDELEDGMDEERQFYDLRLSSLQRHLNSMQSYRFRQRQTTMMHQTRPPRLNSPREIYPTPEASVSSDVKLEKGKPEKEGWTMFQKMVLNDDPLPVVPVAIRKFPKNSDQQLEEMAVRVEELEKWVNMLSVKLESSEKRAAEEQSRRLTAEAELLACQPGQYNGFMTDSVYKTGSCSSKIHSLNNSLSSSANNDPICHPSLVFDVTPHDEALISTPS